MNTITAYRGYEKDGSFIAIGNPKVKKGQKVKIIISDSALSADNKLTNQQNAILDFLRNLKKHKTKMSDRIDNEITRRFNISRKIDL